MPQDSLISVALNIANCAVGSIGAELRYVIFYNNNIERLEAEIQNLEAAQVDVLHSVNAAERIGKEIEDNVKNWLKKVDGIIVEANGFLNSEEHARVGCCNGSFQNLWRRYQLSRQATEIAMEISQVTAAERNFIEISYQPPLRVAFSPFARGYEALGSRTSILREVTYALKDANIYMVGVYGMGGVGKSALIKEIAWQAEHDRSFDVVIVATVTRSPDVKRIQSQLADGLGLKFNEETEKGRAIRLWSRIRKEGSILVILDDIWERLDMAEVGVPFGGDHKGCKLLLSSRSLSVLHREMGAQKVFRLETLSEEESWSLFEKTAGDVAKDITLYPTASKVARSCKGLPLLIVTVAKALKNQELHAWKDALRQLTKKEDEGMTSIAYDSIELSYKYLPSDQHRSLFLLVASLGQEAVHVEDLRLYGWGLGLFKSIVRLTDARDRLYKLIDDLKAFCLILEGEREWVRMHDFVAEVGANIASRCQPFFHLPSHTELKEWPTMDQLKNFKYISLPWCYMHELPENLECPELEILVICSQGNYLEVPDNFFSGVRDLKVVDLGGLMCSPSLPPSFRLLTNIKALYLCKCILEDITIVSELRGLEILSLQDSGIEVLPIELQQLTRLRLLNLGDCYALRRIPANLISSLSELEELYMGNCYFQWELDESSQSNNASLGELRELHRLNSLEVQVQDISIMPRELPIFGKLERYNILIGDGWKWSRNYGGYLETPRALKLKLSSTIVTDLNHSVRLLLNGVQDLHLAEMEGVRNLSLLSGEGFPLLKHLHIQNCAEMEYILDTMHCVHPHQAFPNLQSLVVCNLINLKTICWGPLPFNIFTKLQVIKVKGCDRLQNLFSFSMVRNLSQLLEIDISECESMTNIINVEQGQEDFENNGHIIFPNILSIKLENLPRLISFYLEEWRTDIPSRSSATMYKDHLSNPLMLYEKVAMPKLETMKLSLINTAKLWDDIAAWPCIQNMTNLTIDKCSSLTYLFSYEVGRALVKLRHLEVTNCQVMKEIFVIEEEEGNISSAIRPLSYGKVTFPNLETLVISHMDSLKSIWNNEVALDPLTSMTKIEVSFCPKLLIVIPSHVFEELSNLETLLVTDCDELKIVFETQGLDKGTNSQGSSATQLKTLDLERLPMLEHIWSKDPHGILQLQNLCNVKVYDCEYLIHVFPLSVFMVLLQLQVLDIRQCRVESIVAMDEMAEETVLQIVLPQLSSLTFWHLTYLKCFYPGIHTMDCPMIRKLDVYHCPNLEVFRSSSQDYQEVVRFQSQSLFLPRKVIPIIEELSLSSSDIKNICEDEYCDDDFHTVTTLSLQCFHDESDKFPMSFLHRFTCLENLKVKCSSFVEIFSSEYVGRIMMLRTLTLSRLHNLEYLCKDEQPILENLQTLEVYWCSSLKNMAPSSSSAQFRQLVKLEVGCCSGLKNMIMSSLAKNLLQLRNLCVYNCEMIEEIVASEYEADEGEISFVKLEHLQLENLPMLTAFCNGNYSFKFPLLKRLYVIKCPKMEKFSHGNLSTPNLRKVCYEDDERHWEGELNATITKIFIAKDPKEG